MYVPLYLSWNKPTCYFTPCLSSLSRDSKDWNPNLTPCGVKTSAWYNIAIGVRIPVRTRQRKSALFIHNICICIKRQQWEPWQLVMAFTPNVYILKNETAKIKGKLKCRRHVWLVPYRGRRRWRHSPSGRRRASRPATWCYRSAPGRRLRPRTRASWTRTPSYWAAPGREGWSSGRS